jgi:hypothetical protein
MVLYWSLTPNKSSQSREGDRRYVQEPDQMHVGGSRNVVIDLFEHLPHSKSVEMVGSSRSSGCHPAKILHPIITLNPS